MNKMFLKLTVCAAITIFVYGCNNVNKDLDAIQGLWYGIDGTTKTIEIKGDKWTEGDDVFGKMICQISQYNDSIYELKVIENKNTVTFYTKGMKVYFKLRHDAPSDILHFSNTDTTGRKGIDYYYTTNKNKIQPYIEK